MTPKLGKQIEIGGMLLILLVNAWFLHSAVLWQFDPNDYGGFMDVTWRIYCGQKPYVDFIYHTQPLFIYTMTFFAWVFGFGRHSIFAHIVFTSSAMTLLTFLITRKRLPVYGSLLMTALTAAGYHWHYPFPSFTHDGFLWGTFGLVALWLAGPLEDKKIAVRTGLVCGLSAVLCFMTKSNIGVLYGALFFGMLVSGRQKARAAAGFIGGALAGLALTLPLTHDLKLFLFQTRVYVSTQTDRLINLLILPFWLGNFYWVPLAAVFWAANDFTKTVRRELCIFAGAFGVFVFTYITSSFVPLAHIPMMGIFIGLGWMILLKLGEIPGPPARRVPIARAILIVTALLQMFQTASYGIAIAGGKHPNPALAVGYELKAEALRGWHVPEAWGKSLDAIYEFLNLHSRPEESLLVLTNMQSLYALTKRESLRGIGFQFVLNDMPAPGKQTEEVRRVIMDHAPVWIVTHREKTTHKINDLIDYLGLEDFIFAHYDLINTWGAYGLLRKKGLPLEDLRALRLSSVD